MRLCKTMPILCRADEDDQVEEDLAKQLAHMKLIVQGTQGW